jgi:hypothetical protein
MTIGLGFIAVKTTSVQGSGDPEVADGPSVA